jgi:hypothetical protein
MQLANLYRVVSGCAVDDGALPGLVSAIFKPDAFLAQLDVLVSKSQVCCCGWVARPDRARLCGFTGY